jgi:C4-dicarboxylate-specific signal transduction histidine kinase
VQLQQVLLNLIINAIEAMSGIKERPPPVDDSVSFGWAGYRIR